MAHETGLIEHYGGGGLLAAIEGGLRELGKSQREATVEDLAPVDEFHIGGRPATVELCEQLEFKPEMSVLDIGCGIGGTARFLAASSACRVTGIDLSPTYVDVARTLTDWTGQSERIGFEAGSALEMPFEDDSFDCAVQLHVGMNISDKAVLFAEIARVIRPGGRLGVYDIVRQQPGEIPYPMPWAGEQSQSFVDDAATYRTALESAGFDVAERNRHGFAVDFFAAQARGAGERSGPPPLGLHLLMGAETPVRLGNLRAAVTDGLLAPVEFICTLT